MSFATQRGKRTHYELSDSGPALIFQHGLLKCGELPIWTVDP